MTRKTQTSLTFLIRMGAGQLFQGLLGLPRGRVAARLGLVAPAGVEPATNCLEGSCSNPLSYGASFP